jgi:hypothetical protein
VPSTLSHFGWRVDRKGEDPTLFERSFEKLSPALLQTRSIDEPMPMVTGFDYSGMAKYQFEDGKLPEYLSKDYGIEPEHGLNIQKIIREDIAFVDSISSVGVQVADLIASGIRKCLRGEFDDNEAVAAALGELMVQARQNDPPLNLVSLAAAAPLSPRTARLVRIMIASARSMVRGKFVYGGRGPIEL